MAKAHPKVSASVSPELKRKLQEFKRDRKLKNLSQALTVILDEYLDEYRAEYGTESSNQDALGTHRPANAAESLRLDILEGKVIGLTQEVAELKAAVLAGQVAQSVPARSLPVVQSVFERKLLETQTAPEPRSPANFQPLSYEEIEDEPDEILWSFLEPESSQP